MSLAAPEWVAPFVGLPYVDGGRDIEGPDCWGLVRLVYANFGIQLPTHAHDPKQLLAVAKAFRKPQNRSEWVPVPREDIQALDLWELLASVTIKGRAVHTAAHCGVMVTRALMLHTERATGSVVVPLDHPTVRHRLVQVHRHRTLYAGKEKAT